MDTLNDILPVRRVKQEYTPAMNRILTIAISVLFVFALVGFAAFFTPNATQAPESQPRETTG